MVCLIHVEEEARLRSIEAKTGGNWAFSAVFSGNNRLFLEKSRKKPRFRGQNHSFFCIVLASMSISFVGAHARKTSMRRSVDCWLYACETSTT